jgi:hypothetical protein
MLKLITAQRHWSKRLQTNRRAHNITATNKKIQCSFYEKIHPPSIFTTHFPTTNFCVIFTTPFQSSKYTFSNGFHHQNAVCGLFLVFLVIAALPVTLRSRRFSICYIFNCSCLPSWFQIFLGVLFHAVLFIFLSFWVIRLVFSFICVFIFLFPYFVT